MALKSYSVTLTDTPTMIVSNDGKFGKMDVFINNIDNTNDCHVGASNVSITNGYVLTKFTTTGIANKFEIQLFSGDTLYGICAAGKTAVVGVLLTGQFSNS
jgi:hypothetical protein